jgi:glycosyltransferase involved in cell wall biosynthesis
MKISACIITKNEEDNLQRCLESLGDVVDEIVIVDSGSTDRTKFIATDHNARFIPHDWEGYVGQKNFACGKAKYDWILSIDADEELSPGLQDQVRKLKEVDDSDYPAAFSVSRVVFFENRWVRYGDWYPDLLPRLFHKEKGHFEGGRVHERLVIDGETEILEAELYHHTYQDWEDQKKRVARYAELWARDAGERGKKASALAPFTHAGWRILRSFLLKAGFKGGRFGWKLACAQGRETYLKYKALHAWEKGGQRPEVRGQASDL